MKIILSIAGIIGTFLTMPAFDSRAIEPDGPIARNELSMEALSLLQRREFKSLEDTIKRFQERKERFPDGAWKLHFFLDGFSPKFQNDKAWSDHIKLIEEWQGQFPNSPSAKIANSDAWLGYAWFARGTDYKIKPGGEKPFYERLSRAAKIFNDPVIDHRSPHAGYMKLRLAVPLGFPRDQFERLFKAVTYLEPRYHGHYAAGVFYYTERWHGNPGEWIKKLEEYEKYAPKGEGIYARIVFGFYGQEWKNFNEGTVSWPKLKQSLAELPDGSPWVANTRAFFACLAKDKAMSRPLLEKIGDAPYYAAWNRNGFSEFNACRSLNGLPEMTNYTDSIEYRYLKTFSENGNEWARNKLEANIRVGMSGYPQMRR